MNKKASKTVRLCYGIVFGAFTIIVGALFIFKTLEVYLTGIAPEYSGNSPFTMERAASALSSISVPFYIWMALIVVGFVLWEVFPAQEKRGAPPSTYTLWRMKKKLPSSAPCGLQEKYDFVRREEKIIKILKIVALAVCAAAAVFGLVYFCIPSNFPKEEVTHEMLTMVKYVFPGVLAAFLICCAVTVYEGISAKKQIPAVRDVVKGAEKPKAEEPAKESANAFARVKTALSTKKAKLIIQVALAAVGVALVIVGVFNGSMRDVLVKAINICTECIGLG